MQKISTMRATGLHRGWHLSRLQLDQEGLIGCCDAVVHSSVPPSCIPGISITLSRKSYEHLLRPADDWHSAARVRIRGNAGSGAVTSA